MNAITIIALLRWPSVTVVQLGNSIPMKIKLVIIFASCWWLLPCRTACAQVTNGTTGSTIFVNIGGRQLEMASFGQGTPAVIVEAGLGEPAVESGTWRKVIDSVSKRTRICVYDRAGLGKSDAVTNASRTCQDIVEDLRTLLINAKVPPPYILVGHSVGGFPVRIYAGKYPGEVAGVVLVDSSYPEQWSKLLALLPPKSSQEPDSIKKMRDYLSARLADPNSNSERIDLTVSSTEVRAAGDLRNKPLVVISHSHDWSIDPELPKGVSDKVEQLWEKWQNDLCRLSSNTTHMTAVKAGHYVQTDDPQLVIKAILKTVNATKK